MATDNSKKINLLVKREGSGTQFVRYMFQLKCFDAGTIKTSDLRVIMYISHNFQRSQISLTSEVNAFSSSGAPVYLGGNFSAGVTAEYYDETSGKPPRIATTSYNSTPGLFTTKYILTFNDIIDGVTVKEMTNGNWFDGVNIYIHSSANQIFEQTDGANNKYENSYTKETNTNYTDNSTFILEYWDGSNWLKKTEYTDASTVDTNTGVYPYSDGFKDDTRKDHTLLISDSDSFIDSGNPTTNYGTQTGLTIRSEAGVPYLRALMHFDLSNLSGTVGKGEIWTNQNFVDTQQDISLHTLTASFTETGVTWNTRDGSTSWTTTGGTYDATPKLTQNTTSSPTNKLNSFWIWQNSDITTMINSWIGTTNNGILFRKTDPNTNSNRVEIKSRQNSVNERTMLIIAGIGSGTTPTPTSSKRIFMCT